MERFSAYLASEPRRAARIVLVLVVALVLTMAGIVAALFDLGHVFEAPYPSEDTPLSLVPGGIMWTQSLNVTVDHGFSYTDLVGYGESNMSYIDFRFMWGEPTTQLGGIIVNDSEQDMLSTGSPAEVTHMVSGHSTDDGLTWVYNFVRVTDVLGDGVFGIGDTIAFINSGMIEEPEPEDAVRSVALAYLGTWTLHWEYSYAVHDGEFYSWESYNLNTESPWWVRFWSD